MNPYIPLPMFPDNKADAGETNSMPGQFLRPRQEKAQEMQDRSSADVHGDASQDGSEDDITMDMHGGATPSEGDIKSSIKQKDDLDLLGRIKGMYRILDLISEQGSGGLVDKIIIDQKSLQKLINDLCPGAYVSLTKVDFKALDQLLLRPVGVYGSKDEIITLLSEVSAIDDATAEALRLDQDENVGPRLRSGLYVVKKRDLHAPHEQFLVIYWPQDSTWDDSAPSSVRQNRVTFMRYLTKITDQVICMMSPSQANSIVWTQDKDEAMNQDLEDDHSGRLFSFEVEKTNEQEEHVTVHRGFNMISKVVDSKASANCAVDPTQLMPTLLAGETTQGFLTTEYIGATVQVRYITEENYNSARLRNILEVGVVHLNPNLGDDAVTALIDHGLQARYPGPCADWKHCNAALKENLKKWETEEVQKLESELSRNAEDTEAVLLEALFDRISNLYPALDRERLCPPNSMKHIPKTGDAFVQLVELYPNIEKEFEEIALDLEIIRNYKYEAQKERLITIEFILDEQKSLTVDEREELIHTMLTGDGRNNRFSASNASQQGHSSKPSLWTSVKEIVKKFTRTEENYVDQARNYAASMKDIHFVQSLADIRTREPLVTRAVEAIEELVYGHFQKVADRKLWKLRRRVEAVQKKQCMAQIQRKISCRGEEHRQTSNLKLVRGMQIEAQLNTSSSFVVDNLDITPSSRYLSSQVSFKLTGKNESRVEPSLEYKIHKLGLSADHQQNLQLDRTFIPSPHVEGSERFTYSFRLPPEHRIMHAQLLENDKILIIIDDRLGNLSIFLDSLSSIGNLIAQRRSRRTIRQDKIGKDIRIAFDETKRMLSFCSSTKLHLHVFVFDNNFGTLQAWGNSVNLALWYTEGTAISQACFIAGSEEMLLIDTGGQGRIFSLITQQFRPASISLPQLPTAVFSSPDGSCLVVVFPTDVAWESSVRAYHWNTFGSTQGIPLDLLDVPSQNLILTSMVNRSSVHLISLDHDSQCCQSLFLDITKKTTEFMFTQKGCRNSANGTADASVHNCLIDCHADVWTRFPVIPAVKRQTIMSSEQRIQKSIYFVSENFDDKDIALYFSELIRIFEQRTRKPTGDELKNINVVTASSEAFISGITAASSWNISQFRMGEWLVDLLCLIPIHIAVTSENRFIPLKDGVTSAALEKALLGAEVGRIVDSLSLGWYESIFQSYMSEKPVKVVSSMGEQSVGKSFALNHLVDTSFAGSAMRTTEGIWMSVAPTDDALIVALDFEGVHSIERSIQEDTLLVLFNTAISNLVLFRNNFALSRDITGLFQSFQSSSTVLDPAANPSLFQSTLAIIIKDVVDSDKEGIVREFSLKFQKIVQEEQDANFISRLHAGQLNIIPWPVIESRQFYTLFPALKKRLDKQPVTHFAAGEFLYTLKTLMAKLKANDWGALSQTLVAHRALKLHTMLPNALAYGFSEITPDTEPLKNFDTDALIDMPDTPAAFVLSGLGSQSDQRESVLTNLQTTWGLHDRRFEHADNEWVDNLSAYLSSLVDMRIEHVRAWITSNLSRFKIENANIEALRRMFEGAIVDLKANMELCKLKCSFCDLVCVYSRRHATDQPHDCKTSHRCIQDCAFDDHLESSKSCGLPAGHSGLHICIIEAHLCGEPCAMNDKKGCLGECVLFADHFEEDHICAARVHSCGKPCALQLSENSYSCPGTCGIASDTDHVDHVCDNRMCPVECGMCKRLCSSADHLHGLQPGSIHLCGQVHSCAALCVAKGICEIDTAPQSIEATFTGRHETFQYTKYSQVAKRLPCVLPVPAGCQEHEGPHTHSVDSAPFHFCETRCESCGYFCTQPRGHSQQEHETHHGSMSKTRWAVDGPDGTILELNGRKFASDDDGAPMMCNLVCQDMGRHVHLDYCRANDASSCQGTELQHIITRLTPQPDRDKDWVSHSLYWRRSGFKDPYPRDDQANFAKCDAMCAGPEHSGTATNPPQPSHCSLPVFHPPHTSNQGVGLGYVSNDGHLFQCQNPAMMQQAFHVIFVIDRSGSMGTQDRRPLPNTPVTAMISRSCNNRLGAVYSSLHGFWTARHAALNATGPQAARRDAYSVIMFDHGVDICLSNDFTSSPEQLLSQLLHYHAGGGTDYTSALTRTQSQIQQYWSTERTPVVIFLSDGECNVADATVRSLCLSAVALGKPLSLHAVSFGPRTATLQRMAQIALEVQNNAPHDPLLPATAKIDSSYAEALDTVRLAETFLGIAESLRKPRGSLLH